MPVVFAFENIFLVARITYPGVTCCSKLFDVLRIPLTGLRWVFEDAGRFVAIMIYKIK